MAEGKKFVIKHIYPKDLQELKKWTQTGRAGIFVGSKTSTVIAFDQLALNGDCDLIDLSNIAPQMSMAGDDVVVGPNVSWKYFREWLALRDRSPMTYPTEELASVLAGAATSATGERCFGLGTLREQVVSITYLDHQGREQHLDANRQLADHASMRGQAQLLKEYQKAWLPYQHFKNAPFPRLQQETDLFIGTEGQLGVIVSMQLKTIANDMTHHYFVRLPRWENEDTAHLQLHHFLQDKRGSIRCAELMDFNSLAVLPSEERPNGDGDIVALEILQGFEEKILEQLMQQCPAIAAENIFAIDAAKLRQLRMNVPRATFEANLLAGVIKMGTDAQVSTEKFSDLLAFYRRWAKLGFDYNLFGHFGDSHLHFNFLPNKSQVPQVKKFLEELYPAVAAWQGSPFAEHGVGIIKRPFISQFYTPIQHNMFKHLKQYFDPNQQFFPWGFMSAGGNF
jgi:FAD/FMN-containing dehydrogenase